MMQSMAAFPRASATQNRSDCLVAEFLCQHQGRGGHDAAVRSDAWFQPPALVFDRDVAPKNGADTADLPGVARLIELLGHQHDGAILHPGRSHLQLRGNPQLDEGAQRVRRIGSSGRMCRCPVPLVLLHQIRRHLRENLRCQPRAVAVVRFHGKVHHVTAPQVHRRDVCKGEEAQLHDGVQSVGRTAGCRTMQRRPPQTVLPRQVLRRDPPLLDPRAQDPAAAQGRGRAGGRGSARGLLLQEVLRDAEQRSEGAPNTPQHFCCLGVPKPLRQNQWCRCEDAAIDLDKRLSGPTLVLDVEAPIAKRVPRDAAELPFGPPRRLLLAHQHHGAVTLHRAAHGQVPGRPELQQGAQRACRAGLGSDVCRGAAPAVLRRQRLQRKLAALHRGPDAARVACCCSVMQRGPPIRVRGGKVSGCERPERHHSPHRIGEAAVRSTVQARPSCTIHHADVRS
mmetsp:Transcript_14812/g.43222  ORF Transcript_14812/g.43222 Transcript_14812/m.43222 type:complete len:452 (+) Transcript_14812:109-1464(+)